MAKKVKLRFTPSPSAFLRRRPEHGFRLHQCDLYGWKLHGNNHTYDRHYDSIGAEFARGHWFDTLYQLSKIACFVLGAALSGSYLGTESFVGGRRYAHVLVATSFFLFAAIGLEQNSTTADRTDDGGRDVGAGLFLIALASGLQNAMTTNYGSAVVRTTHVTGSLTDIGIELGRIIGKRDFTQLWKVKLLSSFVLGYAIGAGIGTALFHIFRIYSLLFPASVVFLLGVAYRLYLQTSDGSRFEREVRVGIARRRLQTAEGDARVAMTPLRLRFRHHLYTIHRALSAFFAF